MYENSDLKVGDRVVLLDLYHYDARPDNPFVGSEYECEGTVRYVDDEETAVDWDNGTWNTYYPWCCDLKLVDKSISGVELPV